MLRIASYARKSVYSDNSDSTQTQYDLAVEYCKSHYPEHELYKYEDEGISGATTNRPSYKKLIEDIKDEKINVVICYKIDRISRNVKDFSNFFNFLQEHKVEFVSIKEQIDTSTPLGRAMMYICSVFAQMERETIAERIKDNMLQLARSGKWTGGKPPLGYKRERVEIDGKKHVKLIKDEDEAEFVNMISDTFLEGNYSLSGLETHFKKNKILTQNGKFFFGARIHRILKNPTYCTADSAAYDYFQKLGCQMAMSKDKFDGKYGIISYGRTKGSRATKHEINQPTEWTISVGLHEPMWTSEKYIKIQSRFGQNTINKKRKIELGILRGILKCRCGYTMGFKHKEDKKYDKVYNHYFCPQRIRKGIEYCAQGMVQMNILDDAIIDILKKITLDKNIINKYIDNNKISHRDPSKIKREIEKIELKIDNLTKALSSAEGSVACKYIILEIEDYDKQLSGLKFELLEITALEQKSAEAEENKEKKYKKICQIIDSLEKINYIDFNNLLKELLVECTYDGENLNIKL